MAQRAAGFTLLEIMLVMLLLGVVAGLIVATLPSQDARQQAGRLALTLNHAAGQAATEGQFLRLEVRSDGWQLQRLAQGAVQHAAFLPGYHWQPLSHRLSHFKLPQTIRLRLLHQGRPLKLPATLLFSPDGDTPALTFELQAQDAASRFITWHNGRASEELNE